ncbi:hypothetical protein [Paludisphaera borealis]|uniref:Uncharacterized protein n=1 Tax=Paludisphaera borealis TaxID=1387353 RepID=A0A1U7CKJ5_9BACT|nr:hypothetical protein [Paludisphaera borealis]APW59451.1 hypothetical protein BSF38_00874 [Paludisphaera borealis]
MAEEPKNRRRAGRTPWLKIARAVPLAFDVRKIVLGTIALILIQAGWSALDVLLPATATVTPDILDFNGRFSEPAPPGIASGPVFRSALWRITEPARVLIGPMIDLFAIDRGIAWTGHALLGVLWAVVVTGIVGGAVSRSAVSEVGKGDRATIVESLRFALRSSRSLIAAPLFPLSAAAVCGLICAGFGALYRLPIIGAPLAGVTFFIPLALGLVMAVLLIDLAAAWAFIHVSVAADAESSLDALSRAFSYVNRRPVQFVACATAAWLAGAVGLVAVDVLARAAVHLAAWGLSFTAPPAILAGLGRPGPDVALDSLAGMAPFFWARVVKLLAHAWIYGYYWSSASVIYLALRRDVDGTPATEIKDEAIQML